MRSRAPALIAIGATLLALAAAIGMTIAAQRDARTEGRISSDTLLMLHEVLEAALDAETGQRGYLLTRKEAYLEPYESARRRLDSSLGELRTILRADPNPQNDRSMERLSRLIDGKMAELDRTVSLTRAGRNAEALARVDQDIGKRQMDAIRAEAESLMEQKRQSRAVSIARINTLENSLVPLIAVLGLMTLGLVVLALVTEQKRAAAAAEAAQADALRIANDRANLLARELNHRVKNMFSVILSIVALSARSQAPTRMVVEDIRARIRALSLAHVATQGEDSDGNVDLHTVVTSTLQPYADRDGERITIAGPPLEIPVRMVTPIGLIVHELATNAAKYGAFSAPGGTVSVSWDVRQGPDGGELIGMQWVEAGGPAPQAEAAQSSTGFGSRMIALAVSQLGGTLDRQWPITGAVAHFEFPIS